MASSLAVLIVSLLLLQNDVNAQLYEWSCSPLNASTNHYTLPDLGYGDDEDVQSIGEDLSGSDRNSIEINPLPSTLNCSGTVSAVEYCYASSVISNMITYGTNYRIFTLLTLQQNNLTFEITNMTDVRSTPTTEKCTDRTFNRFSVVRYCCDTLILDQEDQFTVPASNLAFGIIPSASLLRYRIDRFPDLHVEQYSVSLSEVGTPAVGNTFTLSDTNRRTNMALALFQFIITSDLPEDNHSSTPTTLSTTETPLTTSTVSDPSTSDLGPPIGIALGVAVLILIILTICVPLVLYKCHHGKHTKPHDAHVDSVITAQPNQAYGVTKAKSEEVFYETIDTAGNDKNKDQFETEANCAYGVNSDVAVVVALNGAYGVLVKEQD